MRISWRSRKHHCRYEKAKEQFNLELKTKQEIFEYTKERLTSLGVDTTQIADIKDVQQKGPYDKSFYQKLKNKFSLDDERDIIWMKFTKKGHLGVVAASDDINFIIPNNTSDYLKKTKKGDWEYNFSGILIFDLGEIWNEEYVFVFPLPNLSKLSYTRHKIEKEIGNYLIRKDVPVIDFYSHRI